MPLSYRRDSFGDDWDVIVIGSGMGGLTAASLLASQADKRVLVLERHYTAGGFTHAFSRPGWEWDVGIHYLGELGEGRSSMRPLYSLLTGGDIAWAAMPEVYDRIVIGERAFDFHAGTRNFVEGLAADFPGERETLESYVDLLKACQSSLTPFFVDRALPGALGRALGSLLAIPAQRYVSRTVEEVLRPMVRDPLLFDVLTGQFGDYGLPPSQAAFAVHSMVARHFMGGGYYPVGGAGVIAQGCEKVITSAGGAVVVRAEVQRVLMERGRAIGVRMADGRELRAPVVISDAGAPNTWLRLVPREAAERTGLPEAIRSIGPSCAHLSLYVGATGTDAELGLDGTNMWVYPQGDREETWRRFLADPDQEIPIAFLSFPSAKDPSFAARRPGKATAEVVTLASWDWVSRWSDTRWHKRGETYDAWKERMSERLLEILLHHRPGLRGHIAHAELSTPLSTAHFAAHPHGEIYGLTHTPERFALPLRAETPIPGLYMTGADLVSCGVGGALMGGVLATASVLLRDIPSVIRAKTRGPRPATAAKPRAGAPPTKGQRTPRA